MEHFSFSRQAALYDAGFSRQQPRSNVTQSAPTIALVTSGLGPTFGGIGIVASAITTALGNVARVTTWHHHVERPYLGRVGGVLLESLRGAVMDRPAFVFYDHVDLARIHAVTPWLRKIPYAIFLHGTEVWLPATKWRRTALVGASLLVANSQFTVDRARSQNPWLPVVHVTWLGSPFNTLPPPISERPPRALLVGRMARNEVKGQDAALDAWPEIVAAVPQAELFLVGGGDDEIRLRERANALRGVHCLSFVSDDVRDDLYRSSRVFLLPSLQEGFGLVAVEAAYNGMALVGIQDTVMEELFPSGNGAVFAHAQSGNAIAQAAIPLLRDPSLAARHAKAAQARAVENFTAQRFYERFIEIVMPMVSKRTNPSPELS